MNNDDGYFDEPAAEKYDRRHHTPESEITQIVATLQALAAGGDALEFAIGTGRIALPLAAAGTPVTGMELSTAMVREMRRKPGSANIPVEIGDMCNTRVSGNFALVFLVFNTIDNLTTQEAQVACFENAARHLSSSGRFVVETQVPPLHRLPAGETTIAYDVSKSHWGVDQFDIATQTYTSHHVWFTPEGTETFAAPFRYAWPAELDLMARLAGLTLEHRWADWDQRAFTPESTKHISVWRKG